MKTFKKENIYLDISKCTEEEQKSLPSILERVGEHIYEETLYDLWNSRLDDEYIYLALYFNGEWLRFNDNLNRTELTYPEFIKLFDGGETSAENSEVERIRRSAIENLVLMEIDKKMEYLNEIEVARIEGVLTGLKICKEMWAQGTISHENIQEEIYHYQEELDNLNSK